jgi:hypothetical protein
MSKDWKFSLISTLDNTWGDFRWPVSNEKIGMEVRQFKYREEDDQDGIDLGWSTAEFDDGDWETTIYSIGPHWLALQEIPAEVEILQEVLANQEQIQSGDRLTMDGKKYHWEALSFSRKIALGKPSPWGGHSGYPDGHYDKNFIQLNDGRKLLFTRIYSPVKQRLGLKIQLRQSEARLWVNGKEEAIQGALGNLPLAEGYNYVLLD